MFIQQIGVWQPQGLVTWDLSFGFTAMEGNHLDWD